MRSLSLRRAFLLGLAGACGASLALTPASAQRRRPGGPNAPRVPAGSVDLTGTITAVGTGGATVQITTDHGTAITLTVNASTRLQIAGTTTPAATNLAVGQQAEALYQPSDKIALALAAAAPPSGTAFGAITALDLTGGTIQITPLAGSPQAVKLTAQTRLSLNGQPIASDSLAVGQLATLRLATDGSASAVIAQTPPLVDLAGTLTALDMTGGTLQVTTQSATAITLQLSASTTVQLNHAASTPSSLAVGDPVNVEYEYRLVAGTSRALTIVAQAAPMAPTPTPTAATVSLSLNPTSVKGGTPATGTVTLSAAPASAAVVTLASSNPTAAAVPGSVTVAAGTTTATFTVTTTAVTANTSAILFASLGGATGMTTLTVTP